MPTKPCSQPSVLPRHKYATLNMVMPFACSEQVGLHLACLFPILSSVQEACRSLEKERQEEGRRSFVDSWLSAQPSLITIVLGLVKRPGVPAAKKKRMRPLKERELQGRSVL